MCKLVQLLRMFSLQVLYPPQTSSVRFHWYVIVIGFFTLIKVTALEVAQLNSLTIYPTLKLRKIKDLQLMYNESDYGN